jgi:predicted GNAT family N-acyltransferase
MPFYVRASFAPEGDKYEEVGIPHRTMRRVM